MLTDIYDEKLEITARVLNELGVFNEIKKAINYTI